jgi:hypothetical protein
MAEGAGLNAAIADCDVRIQRLLDSVEQAGMPMEWVLPRIVKLRNKRDVLERALPTRSEGRSLTADEIEAMATALSGLLAALSQAVPPIAPPSTSSWV